MFGTRSRIDGRSGVSARVILGASSGGPNLREGEAKYGMVRNVLGAVRPWWYTGPPARHYWWYYGGFTRIGVSIHHRPQVCHKHSRCDLRKTKTLLRKPELRIRHRAKLT